MLTNNSSDKQYLKYWCESNWPFDLCIISKRIPIHFLGEGISSRGFCDWKSLTPQSGWLKISAHILSEYKSRIIHYA